MTGTIIIWSHICAPRKSILQPVSSLHIAAFTAINLGILPQMAICLLISFLLWHFHKCSDQNIEVFLSSLNLSILLKCIWYGQLSFTVLKSCLGPGLWWDLWNIYDHICQKKLIQDPIITQARWAMPSLGFGHEVQVEKLSRTKR